jgi:hypothetical protein
MNHNLSRGLAPSVGSYISLGNSERIARVSERRGSPLPRWATASTRWRLPQLWHVWPLGQGVSTATMWPCPCHTGGGGGADATPGTHKHWVIYSGIGHNSSLPAWWTESTHPPRRWLQQWQDWRVVPQHQHHPSHDRLMGVLHWAWLQCTRLRQVWGCLRRGDQVRRLHHLCRRVRWAQIAHQSLLHPCVEKLNHQHGIARWEWFTCGDQEWCHEDLGSPSSPSCQGNQRHQSTLRPQRAVAQPLCHTARRDDKTCQWHERFGHLHFEALKRLSVKWMVRGLPSFDHVEQFDDVCVLTK